MAPIPPASACQAMEGAAARDVSPQGHSARGPAGITVHRNLFGFLFFFFWLVHGLGSTVLTLSSLPPCLLLWFSAEEVQPQLGQLPGSLLQALLHPEELGGRRVAVQEFWGASGHHPDPRGAGLHQRYVGPAQPAGHGTQNPSTVCLRLED